MHNEPIFSSEDLRLIEALEFNPDQTPAFDHMKGCLVWSDERPNGLSPAGYEGLCDLWIARSFLHRGLPWSAYDLDPEYFKLIWQRAINEGFNWPGFKRVKLSTEDKEYYLRMMQDANDI